MVYKAAVQGERIGIYTEHAARTLQYRHFAVEAIGKEPYFFAPKMREQHSVTPSADAQVLAKSSTALQRPTDDSPLLGLGEAETEADFDHNALFYKRVGDAYAPFAVTPQGAVAASKSGVEDKGQEGDDLLCKIENNGIYVCGIYKKKPYTYRLTADLISKGIPEAGTNFNKALKLCYSTPLGQSLFDKYINGDGMVDSYELKYDDGTISQKRLEHCTIVYVLHQTVMEYTGSSGSTKTYIQKDNHFSESKRLFYVDGIAITMSFDSIKYKHPISIIDIYDKFQDSSYDDLTNEQNYADTIYHELKFHIDFDPQGNLGADITHTIAGWGRRFNGMRIPENPIKSGLLDFPNEYTIKEKLKNPNFRDFYGLEPKTLFAIENSVLPSTELLVLGSSISNFEEIKNLLKEKYPITFGLPVADDEADKDKHFNLHCKLAFAYDYFHDIANKKRLEDNGFTWGKILDEGDFAFLKQIKNR